MKFTKEKKNEIIMYLMEKISQNGNSNARAVAEAFQINEATVHSYVKELTENGLIIKKGRGKYELSEEKFSCTLLRSKNELDSESDISDKYMSGFIIDLPDNVKDIWEYAFGEMMNNVIDHSLAEKVTIKIYRNYLSMRVCIIDNGVGIFNKIKDFFGYKSIDDAVSELFKGKLTTDKANHSGEGIFFTSRMMDLFVIYSGGSFFSHNRYDDNVIGAMEQGDTGGTSVMMELSNFSRKTAVNTFNEYSSVDGGFVKTSINLRNIFDGSPVSRSQAKRIANRLDAFKEVIIDFEDIKWMGQGFAHQLFVVFANNNPEIILTPVNMNDDVRKMLNHVTSSNIH